MMHYRHTCFWIVYKVFLQKPSKAPATTGIRSDDGLRPVLSITPWGCTIRCRDFLTIKSNGFI